MRISLIHHRRDWTTIVRCIPNKTIQKLRLGKKLESLLVCYMNQLIENVYVLFLF